MKLQTFALITVVGMSTTGIIVWSATGPAEGSGPERTPGVELGSQALPGARPTAPTPGTPSPAPAIADRSSFEVGGTLMMEGRLGHAVLPASTDSETYLYVDVKADASLRATSRTPLDVSIVIDRSGSMKGKRLANAIAAARTMVGRMQDGDAVSVVTYSKRAEVAVPTTVIDAASRERITRALGRIRARGDTCISCGITAGMRLLQGRAGTVNRILLLSDGEATAGVRDEPGFRRLADDCRGMAVAVTTIGVDIDYNERIMAALARGSNGRHFFAHDAAALPAIFDQEMESLARTVATDAELTVDLAPGIFVGHVYDRTFVQRGNRVTVPLGTFAAADAKTLLMRLRVPRGPAGERPVAAVRLAYRDRVGDDAGSCQGDLLARVSSDPADVAPLDGLVSARVTRSEAAEALEQANVLFRSGRAGEARGLLDTRRAAFEKRKRGASQSAPRGRRKDVDKSFDFAARALDEATGGFGPADDPADGEAQVRQNQAEAFDLAE